MDLPALANWEATRAALHQIAVVIGAVRVACAESLPNDLHFSLDVSAGGFSTAEMRCGGVLHFDLETLRLAFKRGGCPVFSLDVTGHSQQSLMRRLLGTFGDCGYAVQPSMKRVTGETTLVLDRAQVMAYRSTLDAVLVALARFRSRLSGQVTPLVLWPHHFDLAFIWFATGGMDEHSDAHVAYGFAPFSPGLDRPYIYAYAWSKSTGYLNLPLVAPAQAISEGYTGLYAAYDALRNEAPFDAAVETMLMKYHNLAAARLRQ